MKIAMTRDIATGDLFLRVTRDIFDGITVDVFKAEMREAVKHFVATDPECQALINEMTKEAFKGIDLLAVISEAIDAKVKESVSASAS